MDVPKLVSKLDFINILLSDYNLATKYTNNVVINQSA